MEAMEAMEGLEGYVGGPLRESLDEVVKAVKRSPLPPPWQPTDVQAMVAKRVGSGGKRGQIANTQNRTRGTI